MRAEVITSRENAKFKMLRTLADDPIRHGLALADGIHLVASCLDCGIALRYLLASESGMRTAEIAGLLERASGIAQLTLRDALFREISGVKTPTGVAAVFEIPAPHAVPLAGDALLLDAVQDPGNVGAMLRTAAAAGVGEVLLGVGCAGAWTARVLRAAQGAHFVLRIREQVDLGAALAGSTARSIAAVAHDGRNLYELDLVKPTLWLFGSEGAGLSQVLLNAASLRAAIPLAAGVESLNVAAAAAICLFEAKRQRIGGG